MTTHFTFVYLFGTVAFTYTIQFISHALLGMMLYASVFLLFNAANAVEPRKIRLVVLSGLLAGLALLMEYPAVFPVAIICAAALWRLRNARQVMLFALMVAPFAIAMLAYNYAIFGTPFDVTYRHMTNAMHVSKHAQGLVGIGLPRPEALWGLLFSRHHGLFFISPVLFFAIPGFAKLLRTEWRSFAITQLGICVSLILVYCGFAYWVAGWNLGPRYLTPLMPFLTAAAFYYLTSTEVRKNSIVSGTAIGAAALSVILVVTGTITFPFQPEQIRDPHGFVFFQLLADGAFGLNLGDLLGFPGIGKALIFFTILMLTFFLATVTERNMNAVIGGKAVVAALVVVFYLGAIFAFSPRPSAMEYFARGSIYAFLGKPENAFSDMRQAMDNQPSPELRIRIVTRARDLHRIIQSGNIAR